VAQSFQVGFKFFLSIKKHANFKKDYNGFLKKLGAPLSLE